MDCPYTDLGCSFHSDEDQIKEHIKTCSFAMKEYIKEFLRKKEEELATSITTSQEDDAIVDVDEKRSLIRSALQNQAIQNIHVDGESEEYGDSLVNAGKSIYHTVSKGMDTLGISTLANKVANSNGWKKSKETIVSTKNNLYDTDFFGKVSGVLVEIKNEMIEVKDILVETGSEFGSDLSSSYSDLHSSVSPSSSYSNNIHYPFQSNLPLNWGAKHDSEGKIYFVNHVLKLSTYQDPNYIDINRLTPNNQYLSNIQSLTSSSSSTSPSSSSSASSPKENITSQTEIKKVNTTNEQEQPKRKLSVSGSQNGSISGTTNNLQNAFKIEEEDVLDLDTIEKKLKESMKDDETTTTIMKSGSDMSDIELDDDGDENERKLINMMKELENAEEDGFII